MTFRGFDETGWWHLKIIAVLALLVIVLKMSGCTDRDAIDRKDEDFVMLRKMTFECHDYLVFRMRDYQGVGVLHSESCPCRKHAEKP